MDDGWIDGQMDGQTDGRMMDGWTDGRADGWTDGWTDDKWMDGQMDRMVGWTNGWGAWFGMASFEHLGRAGVVQRRGAPSIAAVTHLVQDRSRTQLPLWSLQPA